MARVALAAGEEWQRSAPVELQAGEYYPIVAMATVPRVSYWVGRHQHDALGLWVSTDAEKQHASRIAGNFFLSPSLQHGPASKAPSPWMSDPSCVPARGANVSTCAHHTIVRAVNCGGGKFLWRLPDVPSDCGGAGVALAYCALELSDKQ